MPEQRYRLDELQIAIIGHIAENPGLNRSEVASSVSASMADAPSTAAVSRAIGEMLRLGCYDHETGTTVPLVLDRTPMRRGARHTYSLHVTEHGRAALAERRKGRGVKVLSDPGQGNGHREATVDRVLSRSGKRGIEW